MSEGAPSEVKGKKSFPLGKFALIAGVCTAVGSVLLFLPPPYPFFEYLEFPGFLLSIAGAVMLFAAWIVYFRRSQQYSRNWSLMYSTIRGGYEVMILGTITLVVARIVQAIVWTLPSELISQPNVVLQGPGPAIIYGILWGVVVSFAFVRYTSKSHLTNPVYRALIFSILTVFIVSAPGTLLHLNGAASYYLLAVAYLMPSYLILGLVLGFSYKRFIRTV
jgi:hypothetical protein